MIARLLRLWRRGRLVGVHTTPHIIDTRARCVMCGVKLARLGPGPCGITRTYVHWLRWRA